jgi:organic radical activating enzyme
MVVNGFHIEPTNICTLKCSGCARTRFIDQWPQHWKNYSLDVDALLHFLDIDLTDKKIALCGNYGDPIYHPDFISFVKKIKDRGVKLNITTNGSYKKQEWWQELVSNLTSDDTITFSIDGTPENFTQYRTNADWESIKTGMDTVAKSQCNSVWKYIPFAFNQNNIKATEKLSQDIGIKNFRVDFSDRFDEITQNLMPDLSMIGPRYLAQTQWKSKFNFGGVDDNVIDAKCRTGQEHFITADGFYSPCCYQADHRFYYKNIFGKNKKSYNIKNTTLSELLEKPAVIEFYQTLDQQPGCQYSCPTKLVDQKFNL